MHANIYLAFLASAVLANGVVAANTHRHAHQHRHAKKDVVFLETDYETVTSWTTVTVIDGEEPTASVFAPGVHKEISSAVSSSSTTPTPSSTSTSTSTTPTTTSTSVAPPPPPPAPTTTSTTSQVALIETVKAAVAAVSSAVAAVPEALVATTAAAQPATTAATVSTGSSGSSSASGGNKRGAAYNDASLISAVTGSGSKISWCYNWGQTSDNAPSDLEYVPMLWGPTHASTWSANAKAAIAKGSKALLAFNEPDNTGQSNLSPATAASLFQQYMNPFSGSASIGAPAITNSNLDGEGVAWLKQWVSACNGQCKFDFCPVHWYSPADPSDFLNHLLQAWDACQRKPIWVTEFAPFGDANTINNFLIDVQDQLDHNATFSFVERYSYFMLSEGVLLSGGSPSLFGKTFAFA